MLENLGLAIFTGLRIHDRSYPHRKQQPLDVPSYLSIWNPKLFWNAPFCSDGDVRSNGNVCMSSFWCNTIFSMRITRKMLSTLRSDSPNISKLYRHNSHSSLLIRRRPQYLMFKQNFDSPAHGNVEFQHRKCYLWRWRHCSPKWSKE